MGDDIKWWDLGYRWWLLKHWSKRLPERLCWHLAWWLPRRIALFAFVRVYSAWGGCGPDYEPVYKSWELGKPWKTKRL